MGKESTKSHLQICRQSFALVAISLSVFLYRIFSAFFFVVNPPASVLETNFRLSETCTPFCSYWFSIYFFQFSSGNVSCFGSNKLACVCVGWWLSRGWGTAAWRL